MTAASLVSALPHYTSLRTRLWLFLVSGVVVLLLFPVEAWKVAVGGWVGLPVMVLLAVFLAALACEYVDSSMGMGYGTTLTPLLLLAGFAPLQIVPAVLLSELVTGLAAGLLHQHDGNVDFLHDPRARRTVLLLGSLSGVGALLAVWLALSVSRFWLGVLISGIVLAMGVVILATRRRQIPYRAGGIVAVGAVAAFNKGLSGGGYGPLVTAGQVVSGLPARQAVAITSLAESLTCLIGVAGYVAAGQSIYWALALPMTLGALLSVPMATHTVRQTSETTLRGLVGAVTLILGVVAGLKLVF
ncbi:MAG: sulfite exporter TauE/SafE family protein [Betaproteobacteria bacterium]|nr:sulfite exporter TauE/SafE family protein [Betaproteobacteria bacterium]